MFNDRRTRKDRRQQHRPEQIPAAGCRRQRNRRERLREYQPIPWWLRTNYAEEVEPPVLDADGGAEPQPESPMRVRPRRKH